MTKSLQIVKDIQSDGEIWYTIRRMNGSIVMTGLGSILIYTQDLPRVIQIILDNFEEITHKP